MSLKNVLITGGAGYIGSVLVPKLLARGYTVTVVDLMIYGEPNFPLHPHLKVIKGNICDRLFMRELLKEQDNVLHLAFVTDSSNNSYLESIKIQTNLEAGFSLAEDARDLDCRRFIFASSASVYGQQESAVVNEETLPAPSPGYAAFKLECENHYRQLENERFSVTMVRACTVCGCSPRQRLDLIINFMTCSAYYNRVIPVNQANKIRPIVHIEDLTDFYALLLDSPSSRISGHIFNIGFENRTVRQYAQSIAPAIGSDVKLIFDDHAKDKRSYNISTEKIKKFLDFQPHCDSITAVNQLQEQFRLNAFENPLKNDKYYNRAKTYSIQ